MVCELDKKRFAQSDLLTDHLTIFTERLAAATTTTSAATAAASTAAGSGPERTPEVRDEADRDVRDEAGAEEDNDDGDGEQPAKL